MTFLDVVKHLRTQPLFDPLEKKIVKSRSCVKMIQV